MSIASRAIGPVTIGICQLIGAETPGNRRILTLHLARLTGGFHLCAESATSGVQPYCRPRKTAFARLRHFPSCVEWVLRIHAWDRLSVAARRQHTAPRIVWSRYDKPAGQPAPRMTDFGGHLMKLKSLIIGSVAAAGLSTAGFAADLGVLTSLDVCDELGLSGLTISSDTNCLQISGGVEYEFNWGDYRGSFPVAGILGGLEVRNADAADGVSPAEHDWESQVTAWLKFVGTASSDFGPAKAVIKIRDIQETRVQNEGLMSDDDDTGGPEFQEAYVQVG